MENVNVCEAVLNKKMDDYKVDLNNFEASSELMVTITLNEYRGLIASNATRTSAIEMANSDKYARENENKNLKAQLAEMKAENYELKKQLENIKKDEGDSDYEN